MQTRLTAAAIAFGMAAMAISTWTWFRTDALVDSAVQRREREIVKHYAPTVRKICTDFGIAVPSPEPQTFEELAEPLGKLAAGLAK